MKFSKKSRYGLRALIDLSMHSGTEYMVLGNIAERNNISPQYLEQVFASLRRAGIVKSIKGPQGGYLLNHAPEKITVADILKILEGTYHLEDEEVFEEDQVQGISIAIQKLVVDQVNQELDRILGNVTLADLEDDYLDYCNYEQGMYYI